MHNIINHQGNANQNLTPIRMAIIKKTRNNKCWLEYGDGNSCALLVGMQSGATTAENSTKVSQKIKNRTTI